MELSHKQIAQLKEAVKKVIKPSEDLVRYYHLCDACKRRIEVTPKSGQSKEGERVSDSWELRFHHYVLYRELAWSVLSEHEVIGYMEYGTRDHWIFPVVAKVLHWVDPETGEDCFSAGHLVSGIKPVGMIRKAQAELEDQLTDLQAKAGLAIEN